MYGSALRLSSLVSPGAGDAGRPPAETPRAPDGRLWVNVTRPSRFRYRTANATVRLWTAGHGSALMGVKLASGEAS
ncbi:hypothetical protein GCM10018780_62300 [Streptomyces lanatus]|nr:hypothetical protein GCM10018780_62300 [Streptomyces lanatus]